MSIFGDMFLLLCIMAGVCSYYVLTCITIFNVIIIHNEV
jgi:hypothetical protein